MGIGDYIMSDRFSGRQEKIGNYHVNGSRHLMIKILKNITNILIITLCKLLVFSFCYK